VFGLPGDGLVQDAFHAALRRRVEDILVKYTDTVTRGRAASLEEYREHVGYIRAMRDVLELCTEIEERLYSTNPLKRES
jgi:hypothetical protein